MAAYAVVDSGVLGGLPALALLLALLVLAPTHSRLARRVSVNIAMFLGWSPVLWWIAWPGSVNHAGVLIGLGSAATTAAGLCGWRLRPVAASSEAMLLLAAPLAAAAAVFPWLSRSPRAALEQMLPGVDNSAHFAMFWSLRAHGAVPEALGASPDGSVWGAEYYPRGFHTMVATLSEALAPRVDNGVSALPLYLQGQAGVVVLGVLMATATVLGLRGVRGRPLVLLPALVLMWTALLWEPGQKVFANGFTAFWLGAVAAGVALLIAVSSTRPTLPDVAAVAGLLLLVSHCWLPLVVLAAPAAVLVFVPLFGVPWSRRATVAVLLLVAGGLGAMKAALVLIETVPLGVLVSADGGYDAPALLPVLMLVLAGSWALLILGSSRRQGARRCRCAPVRRDCC